MAKDEAVADADADRTMPDSSASGKPLLFYKLMVASMIQDKKLKIPGKVVKRIEQELSIVVTLLVPDGRKWNMKLGKDGGGNCWLGDGWVEFMKHYSIRVGYLLVFRYKGDSTFVVNVFNLANAEIQYSVGGSDKVGEDNECPMKKGSQSGNYHTKIRSGSEKVGRGKKILVTKGSRCGNDGAQRKSGSSKGQRKKVRAAGEGKESGNGCTGKKLGSKDVTDDEFYLMTEDEETGNDGTKKKLGSKDVTDDESYLMTEDEETGNDGTKKNLGSKDGAEHELYLMTDDEETGNDGIEKKFGSEEVGEDGLCSVTKGKESGNDGTEKKLGSEEVREDEQCSVPKMEPGNNGVEKNWGSSQPVSGIICGLQSKLSELHTEYLSEIECLDGGSKKVQLEKEFLMKGSKSGNDGTENSSGSANIRQDKQCSVSNRKESGKDFNGKKLDVSPPGFAPKSSQQMPGIDRGLTVQSKLSESHTEFFSQIKDDRGGPSCRVEKQVKPGNAADSPGSFPLVKDVTPGYYRANVMSFKRTKPARVRKAKNPRPKNPGKGNLGLGTDGVGLNSPGKEKLTPEMPISKMAPLADRVTADAKCEGHLFDHMVSIADGADEQLPVPEKLTSETQLQKQAINVTSSGQVAKESTLCTEKDQFRTRLTAAEIKAELTSEERTSAMITKKTSLDGAQTPVKRKKEINIADLLNQTMPMTMAIKHVANASTADLISGTTEKTAASQKKPKIIQQSAIPHPCNPYCTVHMRASYLQKNGYLHMPANFATKYLKETSGHATLENSEGKQWEVRISSFHVRITLSQGWHQFAMDNHLKEGDICIFELLNSVNTIFKVTFVRSPKEPPPADQEALKL